jgi:hypothetical protein
VAIDLDAHVMPASRRVVANLFDEEMRSIVGGSQSALRYFVRYKVISESRIGVSQLDFACYL